MRVLNVGLVIGLSVVTASACSKDSGSEPQPAASEGNEAPPILPATGTVPLTKLSDGQIAQILATIDDAEIEQAKLALDKSKDAAVRGYAQHMVEQHTAAKEDGARLASQSGMQLADSPKAQELHANASKMLEQLKAADDSNFDVTYLQAQVDQHADVLKLVTDQLQPAVNDPNLRDQVGKARDMVSQHLDQAKQLRKQ